MPRPETAFHLLTSLACVAANNELRDNRPCGEKKKHLPPAIRRALPVSHHLFKAYIHIQDLSIIVQFFESSILTHENHLRQDSR